MKPDIFLDRIVFRLIAPMLYGSVVYILILLIFDSLTWLTENFFSLEIFVTIALCYIQFEALRAINLLIGKIMTRTNRHTWHIILQFGAGLVVSILIVSLGLWFYFRFVVGFTSFRTELITFNAMFLLTSLLYNLIHLSLFFLDKKNEVKINAETMLRKNLEADLESFKNEVNPDLLFDSFESLIGLIHHSKKEADEFIGHLSAFYRYCLHNRNNDLVPLREELKLVDSLIHILNTRYSGQINLVQNISKEQAEKLLIPCALLSLLEIACRTSIIDQHQGLTIDVSLGDDYLQIKHPLNKRLGPGHDYSNRLERMKTSYLYFSDLPFERIEEDGMQLIKIPLLKIDDSELC